MALRSGFRTQIGHFDDGPMWVNGKTADRLKKLSAVRFLWAFLGGIPSGWGQFGAVKKWAVDMGPGIALLSCPCWNRQEPSWLQLQLRL